MKAKAPGFTLVELILVVSLIGILIAVMTPGFKMVMNKVRRFATERIMDKVEFGLNQYSIDSGGYPKTRDGGLSALMARPAGRSGDDWKGPYLEGVKFGGDAETGIEIMDQWNRALEYNNPPVNFPDRYKQYELISFGPSEDDQAGYISRGR